MKIKQDMTLDQVKDIFCETYNSLKLEFYRYPHKDHRGSSNEEQLNDARLISELIGNTKDFEIAIRPDMSVTELEKTFENHGLHVQVFRWSNNLWLQTISSDHLSLETQNTKGQESITL